MRRFTATVVAAVELPDLETFTVVMAESPDGEGERLELHRADSFDEQDRMLGMDTYCLCTESGTTYGGIVSWTLSHDSLEVRLDQEAASHLGVEGGFLVSFPPEHLRTLQDGLEKVLG